MDLPSPKKASSEPSLHTPAEPYRSSGNLSSASTNSTNISGTKSRSLGSRKERLLGKISKIASWLTTSEPSSQALKQYKQEAFRKAGISPQHHNNEAHAKLHAPIGEIPPDAIRADSGMSPEEAMKRKVRERRRRRNEPCCCSSSGGGLTESSASWSSSGFFLTPAWDNLPLDGSDVGKSHSTEKGPAY